MQRAVYTLPLLLFISSSGFGQHPTVLGVPQSFSSIQSAVDAAQPGDTVLVDHGVYYENVVINKELVLASRFILDGDTSHISRTIIDGKKYVDWRHASTILIEGRTDTNTVITGLTIRGGGGTRTFDEVTQEWWLAGGGIFVRSYGARVVRNLIIENVVHCSLLPTFGGGIAISPPLAFSDQEYAIIEYNTVRNNEVVGAKPEAGGIGLYASGRIVGNTVQLNKVRPMSGYAFGGGIYVWSWYFDSVMISKNRILENFAQRGAGLAMAGRKGNSITLEAHIVNNLVAANAAQERGGGVAIVYNVDAFLINNTIVRNTSGLYGSGLDIPDSPAYLLNNIVFGNTPVPQVFSTSMVQAYHNLIENGFIGDHNIGEDPLFLDDDITLVDAQSPLFGGGEEHQYFHGKLVSAPREDIDGRMRHSAVLGSPDLGAVEYKHASLVSKVHTHATKLWVSISADLGQLGPDSLFSVGRRVTKVDFFLNDTLLLSGDALAEGIHLASPDDILLVETTHDRGRNDPSILVSCALEGRDAHDFYTKTRGFNVYSGLRPGKYTFKIRTEHTELIQLGWAVDTVDIYVPPPWWETWWFRLCLILTSFGVFTLMYSREVKRNRRRRAIQQAFSRSQIESQEAERKRLAGELHDGLGQNLLLAHNELQQYLQHRDGEREGVERAAGLLKESIDAAREMASNLHPHQLDRLGFCTALIAMTENVSHATGITVRHRCDHIDGFLQKETAVHLYRIVQEALSNIVRHASAHEVSIHIWKNPSRIEVLIADNGKGFDKEKIADFATSHSKDLASHGFGLSSMAERARIIGGELTIESSPGNGTSVSVTFPLRRKQTWKTQYES